MRIHFVDRSKYEVFFIPFENKKPGHAEIQSYLKIHYPFFSASCRVYSHPCVICGSKYLIVTVFQSKEKNKKKSILNGYSSTASSLLAQSSYAQKACEIICENEHIRFGKNPESFYLGERQDEVKNSETIRLTFDDLNKLAERERLKGYRYGNSRTIASVIAFGIAALLLFIPLVNTQKESVNTPSNVIEPKLETSLLPTFWETFNLEINAVYDSDGIIREYEYNAESRPTNNLSVRKCDPGYLYDELSKKSVFKEVIISKVAYQKKEYFFDISYSSAHPSESLNYAVDGNVFTTIYDDSRDFDAFCTEQNIALQGISYNPTPVYSLKVNKYNLSATCFALAQYCNEKNKTIGYLHILRTADLEFFSILIGLLPARNGSAYKLPMSSNLETVFDVQKKPPDTTNIQIARIEENRIGQIQETDYSCFVFSKTNAGKIQMEAK